MLKKRLAAMAFVAAISFAGVPATASAVDYHPNHPTKCNAGNGNGSEPTPATDCDPGNSGAKNNGGD